MRTSGAAALLSLMLAAPLSAEGPLSAIDWLSDSIAAAPVERSPQTDLPSSAATPDVTMLPLAAPVPAAVGLIAAVDAGLPADLWMASSGGDIASLLNELPADLLPASQALLKRVILAELQPPRDADGARALLLARIDRLLALGALEEAQALLDLTGSAVPELFRRRFDVALLTGAEAAACSELIENPRIFPTYPARVFCLARMGDWHTAAVTLDTANALGLLTPEEDALLARYIHPELAEDLPPLRPPQRPTPLEFRLYEAVGEPLPTGPLAIAFAHADLRAQSGWKAQIEAAERLARVGAIDPNLLLGLYTERRAAASGGVWERVAVVQALDRAIVDGDAAAVSDTLAAAHMLMAEIGLTRPLALAFAARLTDLPLSGSARATAYRLALVAADGASAARWLPETPLDRHLLALASGQTPPPAGAAPLQSAIRANLLGRQPPARFAPLLDQGRTGEALLRALALLARSNTGNTDDIGDAIGLLRFVGFESEARQAAIEAILSDGSG